MKIAIKGHASRGKEIIQILESLGGINSLNLLGTNIDRYYYIYDTNTIMNMFYDTNYKTYTLEEFEKEFPFKIGDEVLIITGIPHKIIALEYCMGKLSYKLDNGLNYSSKVLTLYKEMKEERNITLTLDKAKEWYKKGGELKEIALQAFDEKELNPLPRSWAEFCDVRSTIIDNECFITLDSSIENVNEVIPNHCRLYKADRNICPSKESAEAHLAMIQLEQLRDCWRQGWKPDWLNGNERKYAIKGWRDKSSVEIAYVTHEFLSFPTYELALEFQECFRDLIEKAGDLI